MTQKKPTYKELKDDKKWAIIWAFTFLGLLIFAVGGFKIEQMNIRDDLTQCQTDLNGNNTQEDTSTQIGLYSQFGFRYNGKEYCPYISQGNEMLWKNCEVANGN